MGIKQPVLWLRGDIINHIWFYNQPSAVGFFYEWGCIFITYTNLLEQFLRNVGQVGSTDTSLISDFQNNLNQRYQLVLAKMKNYTTQVEKTASTVAAQQYYHYPAGIVTIESMYITIGSVKYPMTCVNSQYQWDWLNSLIVQPTALPQFFFPRKSDFGVYPIPQSTYTITFNYHYRDRGLTVADYTTGTTTVTNASTTVTGSGTTWTTAMNDRWFQVTSTTSFGQGVWYKISSVDSATSLTLESAYEGTTGSSLTYAIGQVPAIPEEGHIMLVDGATADFYSGIRHDVQTATWYNNKFFTGDGNNNSRDEGDNTISGGLIGLCNLWRDRNAEHVIDSEKEVLPFLYKNWGGSIS